MIDVLIVDDNADNRDMFGIAVASAGFSFELACDGLEAMDRLQSGVPYRVMILDLSMPGMNGDQVLREIAKTTLWKEMSIVVVTAAPELLYKIEPKRVFTLQKPIAPTMLGAFVSRIINGQKNRLSAPAAPTAPEWEG